MKLAIGGDRCLELVRGDITRETTDAIVNAANSSLMGGGGVDGAIHRRGGPAILDACRDIVAKQGGLPAGRAVATPAGNLAARWVIHTVGPFYKDGNHGEPATLASCYRTSMAVAESLGCASVAFPSISTGAYCYPLDDAAAVVLPTLREALATSATVRLVRMVLFDEEALAVYVQAAESL